MSDSLKIGLAQQVLDIFFATSKEVVQAYYLQEHSCNSEVLIVATLYTVGTDESTSHTSTLT